MSVLVWQENIFRSLEIIKEQNKIILECLKNQEKKNEEQFAVPNLTVEFPLKTDEDVVNLENNLKSSQTSVDLVCFTYA